MNTPSMLPGFVSRSLQLLDSSNHHGSTSPSSYSEDSILPTSSAPTSPTRSTFGEIYEKPLSSTGHPSVCYF